MGAVNITNVAGQQVAVNNFTINGTQICQNGTALNDGTTLPGFYSGKSWTDFSGLNLDITLNGATYHVNLNKGHYFGGNDFHYPGDGSDVNFVLLGTNTQGTAIQFRLTYRQTGAATLLYSDDSKNLDRV